MTKTPSRTGALVLLCLGVTWFGIAAWLIVERPFGISFAIPSALSTRLSTFLVFLGRLGVIFILCGWVLPMSTGLWMLIKSRR